MNALKHSVQNLPSEVISQPRKDFALCEKISQLREKVRNLIEVSGLPKSDIADALQVWPSTVSSWLDRTSNGRNIDTDQAECILRLVKPRPRMILESMEAVEEAIILLHKEQFGSSDLGRF